MIEAISAILIFLIFGFIFCLPEVPQNTYTFENDDLESDPPTQRMTND